MLIRVEVVPPNSAWPDAFQSESRQVALALGKNVITIHHIGSTAIPGIYAKPVIDMLVEVRDLTQVDAYESALIALGYEALGEFGISGRRYFRKDNTDGVRTHHVHVFEHGSPEVLRHLAFRDYMIAHPEAAQQYSDLKRQLTEQLNLDDIEGYMDGKDAFVKIMEKCALDWWKEIHP